MKTRLRHLGQEAIYQKNKDLGNQVKGLTLKFDYAIKLNNVDKKRSYLGGGFGSQVRRSFDENGLRDKWWYKVLKWGSNKLLEKKRGGGFEGLDSGDYQELKNITGMYPNKVGVKTY